MNHANPLMGIPKTRPPLKIYQSSARSPTYKSYPDTGGGQFKGAGGRPVIGLLGPHLLTRALVDAPSLHSSEQIQEGTLPPGHGLAGRRTSALDKPRVEAAVRIRAAYLNTTQFTERSVARAVEAACAKRSA